MTIVFYDKIDNDGRGARAVFELANGTENIEYIGLNRDMKDKDEYHYIDILEDEKVDTKVYFLDLAPRDQMEALVVNTNIESVTIIDHHQLNWNPLDNGFEYVYDSAKSACLLAWEYFFENEEAPLVVRLINDRDTWTNSMQPETNWFLR